MRFKTARLWLLVLFVAVLVLHFCIIANTFLANAIYADDFESLTLQTLTIYSIPLGIILGAFFGQGSLRKSRVAPSAFYAALALSCLWNGLLLARTVVFGFAAEDLVESYAGFQTRVSAASMFLIAGALTFFFTKAGSTDE